MTVGGHEGDSAAADGEVEIGVPGHGPGTLIGRGAAGSVYRSRHLGLDREMAIKILDGHRSGLADHERFVEEARTMARLDAHPDLVRVTDVGITTTGRPYLVMELLDAGSLADVPSPLPPTEAVAAAVAAARALAYLHEHDLVHRDVKPANLLRGRDGQVKLGDLGAVVSGGVSLDAGVVGTPEYCAPELLTGSPPSPASDLYGLGATLHHLLVGEPPLPRAPGESLADYAGRVGEAAHAGDRTEIRRREMSDVLTAVVESLLELDPTRRPASAREVARQLENGADPAGRPSWRRWSVTVVVGLVAALVAALLVSSLGEGETLEITEVAAVADTTATVGSVSGDSAFAALIRCTTPAAIVDGSCAPAATGGLDAGACTAAAPTISDLAARALADRRTAAGDRVIGEAQEWVDTCARGADDEELGSLAELNPAEWATAQRYRHLRDVSTAVCDLPDPPGPCGVELADRACGELFVLLPALALSPAPGRLPELSPCGRLTRLELDLVDPLGIGDGRTETSRWWIFDQDGLATIIGGVTVEVLTGTYVVPDLASDGSGRERRDRLVLRDDEVVACAETCDLAVVGSGSVAIVESWVAESGEPDVVAVWAVGKFGSGRSATIIEAPAAG